MTRSMLRALATVITTALLFCLAPAPAPVHAQFTDQRTWGGTAGGTANAITVAIANYNLQQGVVLRFIAANDNTGDATININSSGAINARRITNTGIRALVGGEIKAGGIISVIYDGSVYKLVDRSVDQVGQVADFRGAVPAGWLAEDGSCVSRTATATVALFAYQGTAFGVCDGSTTFALADSRGRVSIALDNQGGAGSAGRTTSAGSGCTATALTGTGCGAQNFTLTLAQMPPFTPAGTIAPITPAGTINQITPAGSVSSFTPSGAVSSFTPSGSVSTTINGQQSGVVVINNAGPGVIPGGGSSTTTTLTATSSFTGNLVSPTFTGNLVSPTFTGTPFTPAFTGTQFTPVFTGTSIGSGSSTPGLPPASLVVRAVKL